MAHVSLELAIGQRDSSTSFFLCDSFSLVHYECMCVPLHGFVHKHIQPSEAKRTLDPLHWS